MTIASEIARLQGVKSNILAAIEAKNVIVPPGAALADCPLLIDAISGGGGDISIITKRISSEQGICVVDENGNIGQRVTNYYPHVGNTYFNNFAIVIEGADFSSLGLGRIQFLEEGTTDIDGRTYRTVTINGVTWLAENLDLKASGIAIGQSGTSDSEPRANYYNNDEATYGVNGNKYGLLYNWIAVKHLQNNRSTLMPGWHVPTVDEWDALATAVGGASTAGTKLKSTSGWTSGNGTNDYGFSAFPSGAYHGSFYGVGSNAYFWTSSENSGNSAYGRLFSNSAPMVSSYYYKYYQFSVRLVKDS